MILNLEQSEQAAIVNVWKELPKSCVWYEISKCDLKIYEKLVMKIVNQKTPDYYEQEKK